MNTRVMAKCKMSSNVFTLLLLKEASSYFSSNEVGPKLFFSTNLLFGQVYFEKKIERLLKVIPSLVSF